MGQMDVCVKGKLKKKSSAQEKSKKTIQFTNSEYGKIENSVQEEFGNSLSLDKLPSEILLLIFKFFNRTTLGCLAKVCNTFKQIVNSEVLWVKPSQKCLVTNLVGEEILHRSKIKLTFQDRCRMSYKWKKKLYSEKIFFSQKVKYMPWMDLDYKSLLLSRGNTILQFERKRFGSIKASPISEFFQPINKTDICRFVRKDGYIFAGNRGGYISLWDEKDEKTILHKVAHATDINTVDIYRDYFVTGSKDKSSKIWRLNENMKCENYEVISTSDWVWSLSINPTGEYFALGTSGHSQDPLFLYDIKGNLLIKSWNYSFKSGAGILDIHWESENTFLTTGYDSYVRLWDRRTSRCERFWEDPHNTTLYCLASDNLYTIMSGSANHGRVLLWDRRYKPIVQMYYTKAKQSSPVYSVSFDACQLYAALDQSLNMLDFYF